ncbi:MAG TPA: hypothetical protein VGO93_31045 [Candidatus Xenobia bacterium]|jgi:hypothetical protein
MNTITFVSESIEQLRTARWADHTEMVALQAHVGAFGEKAVPLLIRALRDIGRTQAIDPIEALLQQLCPLDTAIEVVADTREPGHVRAAMVHVIGVKKLPDCLKKQALSHYASDSDCMVSEAARDELEAVEIAE